MVLRKRQPVIDVNKKKRIDTLHACFGDEVMEISETMKFRIAGEPNFFMIKADFSESYLLRWELESPVSFLYKELMGNQLVNDMQPKVKLSIDSYRCKKNKNGNKLKCSFTVQVLDDD